MQDIEAVLRFWFTEAGPKRWFKRDRAFDNTCRQKFLTTLEAAGHGACIPWRSTPRGRCAEIIVLDQLSRNIFRGTPEAFAQDSLALACAREAVASGDDLRMSAEERYFCYMPFMHAEDLAVHDEALRLFTALGNREALRYEKAHREVIRRFGRYPSRNPILGRESSPEELDYLNTSAGF